jgi:hypothetical protein
MLLQVAGPGGEALRQLCASQFGWSEQARPAHRGARTRSALSIGHPRQRATEALEPVLAVQANKQSQPLMTQFFAPGAPTVSAPFWWGPQ